VSQSQLQHICVYGLCPWTLHFLPSSIPAAKATLHVARQAKKQNSDSAEGCLESQQLTMACNGFSSSPSSSSVSAAAAPSACSSSSLSSSPSAFDSFDFWNRHTGGSHSLLHMQLRVILYAKELFVFFTEKLPTVYFLHSRKRLRRNDERSLTGYIEENHRRFYNSFSGGHDSWLPSGKQDSMYTPGSSSLVIQMSFF